MIGTLLDCRSVRTLPNHTASCAEEARAMYSASAVDKATQDCLVERQDMTPFERLKQYPEVDLRSLVSPAQSASVQPLHLSVAFLS